MFEDLGLTGFPDFTGEEHLVDHGIDFVEVENQVQFADVVEILVENFDEVVDGLEIHEVVVAHVDADAKVESSVSSINDLEIPKLDEVGVFGVSDGDARVDFLDQLLLFVVVEIHVPFGQTSLSRAVLNQDEPNHGLRSQRQRGGGGGGGGRGSGRNANVLTWLIL